MSQEVFALRNCNGNKLNHLNSRARMASARPVHHRVLSVTDDITP